MIAGISVPMAGSPLREFDDVAGSGQPGATGQ